MATYSDMMTALRAADAAGNTEDATRLAEMISRTPKEGENYSNEGLAYPESSEALKSATSRFGEGIGGSIKKLAQGINTMQEALPPGRLLKMATGGYVSNKLGEEVQKYENLKPYLGTAGTAGEITGDIATTALPIAKVGTAVSKAPMLARTLGRAAPAAGDIAANAAYSGGRAAVEGKDAGEILSETLWGAGGAAVPHAILGGGKAAVKAVGNKVGESARRAVTPEAKALLDEGIQLTPGQMAPDSWVGHAEEMGKRIPFLGKSIERAQGRAGEQFVTKAVNDALAPLEVGVKTTGRKALDEAHDIVSNHYNKFLDDVHIDPGDLRANLVKLDTNLSGSNPASVMTLTEKQSRKMYEAVTDHVTPLLEQAEANGLKITGRQFKNVDSAIGDLAREQIKKGNSKMGEAYYELQRQLRTSLSPKRLGAEQDIKKANQSFKNLLAVHKAGDREGGVFTPSQLRKAMNRQGDKPTKLVQAGEEVLKKGEKRNYALDRFIGGLAGGSLVGFFNPLLAGGIAGAGHLAGKAYNPGGLRAMSGYLAPGTKATLMQQPPGKLRKLARALAAPEYTKSAAQAGRILATDEGE